MIKFFLTFIFLCIFSFNSDAVDFTAISIKECSKEVLSDSHLRFSCPKKKDIIIHLQIDTYDNDYFWKNETLETEIRKMETLRKVMSSIMGLSDYKITTFRLIPLLPIPKLVIKGSYRRPDDQLIQFNEINFYGNENFLQLKIISNNLLPADDEIENLIKEILPMKVEIDKWR